MAECFRKGGPKYDAEASKKRHEEWLARRKPKAAELACIAEENEHEITMDELDVALQHWLPYIEHGFYAIPLEDINDDDMSEITCFGTDVAEIDQHGNQHFKRGHECAFMMREREMREGEIDTIEEGEPSHKTRRVTPSDATAMESSLRALVEHIATEQDFTGKDTYHHDNETDRDQEFYTLGQTNEPPDPKWLTDYKEQQEFFACADELLLNTSVVEQTCEEIPIEGGKMQAMTIEMEF